MYFKTHHIRTVREVFDHLVLPNDINPEFGRPLELAIDDAKAFLQRIDLQRYIFELKIT